MNVSQPRTSGFTLLEVMIAIAITAMIGVGATQLLSNIIESRQSLEIRSEQLASLQRFDMILSRDISQYINRSIRDEYGETQPALLLNREHYLLEFTRAGWRNSPLAEHPRSELQRVAYQLERLSSDACTIARERLASWGLEETKGDCLVRYFWPALDRANRSEPIAQMLLEQVDALDIEVLTTLQEEQQERAQQWHSQWPELSHAQGHTQSARHIQAVRWRFRLPSLGELERLWLIVEGSHE